MPQPHWTAGLHHDGSALYVSNPLPTQGESVTVRLRVPCMAPVRAIYLRTAPDGEEHLERMHVEREDGVSRWWAASLRVTMPRIPYRFKIVTDEGSYWLNALGVSRADSPDFYDFKLLADFAAPGWLDDAVFYQIFPDRFYNGNPANDVPTSAWSYKGYQTQQREWGAPPLPYQQGGNLDFYGGDLQGVTQKLDYLRDLGVNAIFLNPIFTAYTNHRYDVANYHQIDPHLGGDAALLELRRALDAAGMRLILDVTPNHCGWRNVWFKIAQADPTAPSAEYFTFIQHPNEYETWLGHRSLVKLNYRSAALRDAMYRAPDSVLRRWLAEPYRIDGWRLDVANMTARQGMVQLAHEVWREMRAAVKQQNPQAFLFGENFFDGTPHLQGDELDATMNYRGFAIPLWEWLVRPPEHIPDDMLAWWTVVPLPAEGLAEQWGRFRAAIPWVIARQQFIQLGSHDTPRILSILNSDRSRMLLAVTLLMTFPGVPCVYYGDEVGLEGFFDPDNRRCMPWDESAWDQEIRAAYKRLIALRRTAPALRHGGFQMLHAQGNLLAYMRQSAEQRLLIIAHRGETALAEISLPVWPGSIADSTRLTDLHSGAIYTVTDGQITLRDLPPNAALVLEG